MDKATYTEEMFEDIWEELLPVIEEHWAEMATGKGTLNLDKGMYEALQEGGNLVLTVVRYEGVLVGYSSDLIASHPHNIKLLYADNDAIFIKKDYRSLGLGDKLLEASDEALTLSGATMREVSCKDGSALSSLLSYNKFRHIEQVYAKPLGG